MSYIFPHQVRIIFRGKEFGYHSSREEGFRSGTDQCWKLGDWNCLPIPIKETGLSWYALGMQLYLRGSPGFVF